MSVANTTRLVLWDIDHTLVDLPGLGVSWYTTALATVTGTTPRQWPRFGGRTERAITLDILAGQGIEATEELIQRLWTELVGASERTLSRMDSNGRALPGAIEALSTMAGHRGVVQSLVTGNLPEISRHKLTAFGMHDYVDFDIGGYGSLSAHRPDLVPYAVERATAKHGTAFPPDAVVIIGDTPHDIDAARQHGARAIGVATGQFTAKELRSTGAHTVLTDLRDTSAVHAAVLGESH